MREIKFRAWDGNFWYLFNIPSLQYSLSLTRLFARDDINYCRFTGLKDHNGKEIYEGDIVRHRQLDRPDDAIKYGLYETMMAREHRDVEFEGGGFTPLVGWTDDGREEMQWEVIGNIYENPKPLN